jgi:hypothetical protein
VGNIQDEFEDWAEDFEPELSADLFDDEDVELIDLDDFEEEEE